MGFGSFSIYTVQEGIMRFDQEMVRRGLIVVGVLTLFGGWFTYTAYHVAQEVGRTLAFGLRSKTIAVIHVDVNRAAKGDRVVLPVSTPAYNGPYLAPWQERLT